MNLLRVPRSWPALALVLGIILVTAGGCGENSTPGSGATAPALTAGATSSVQEATRVEPPTGLVQVAFGGQTLTFWPYTGTSLKGTGQDPINLVFVGQADPVKIRAALMALDGDRTAFGFPTVYPFNATWSDASGDIQATYAEGGGWTGSVIQLQMGNYEPVRVHLRLFGTDRAYGSGGTWTLGAAHFEVMIPGTADHQVLSWELAEQIVVVDMMRSQLLDPGLPMAPTGMINQAPSFLAIPKFIYNQLPPELIGAIGGPAPPVSADVPLASDGQGTILHLAGSSPVVPGEFSSHFTFTYQQVVPKPFCAQGPLDWVLVEGPVTFDKTVTVDAAGAFRFNARYSGRIQVTPVDVTVDPPAPAGEPYFGEVSEFQQGSLSEAISDVMVQTKRIAPQAGGTELLMNRLKVSSQGGTSYRSESKCLSP